jgi:D-arginine dehydrogenase
MERVDVVVVGTGIAGASVAYALVEAGVRVMLVEREGAGDHHSTGRSAAVFTECYAALVARRLAMGSRAFLENPPDGFTEVPLLNPRPLLFVGREDQRKTLTAAAAEAQAMVPAVRLISAEEAEALFPALRPGYAAGGVVEPGARDIDVAALHQGYLRGIRRRGGRVALHAEATEIARHGDRWRITAGDTLYDAEVVVNAAGAWGDEVAVRAGVSPLGLRPLRRTAFTVPGPGGHEHWPMLIDVDEQWYCKPEGPNLLASPADETPVPPGDVRHEEVDVALAIERINGATTLGVRHVHHAWAGLRTFTGDRVPAAGFDPDHPGFVWLVGQGGYGIKTSPALGRWTAAIITGAESPEDLVALGLRQEDLDPVRFR